MSTSGRFPSSSLHQVSAITGLNTLRLCVLALKMALDAGRAQNSTHSLSLPKWQVPLSNIVKRRDKVT